ncbi:MAG: hypothetical protein E7367_00165 [Clostridiales bacterium]|nr:hypothetical protein [Clostridiales bacterium]MBO5334367.1 hypothetical protein [Clostridia bacterium]
MEKFVIGMLIGAVGGAVAVTNSYRMRTIIKKGQDEVLTKVNDAMDEKIEEMKRESKSKAAAK